MNLIRYELINCPCKIHPCELNHNHNLTQIKINLLYY
jgi:hypothetical protein